MAAECYFLDVAQGTSQVILLGGGRALVIDAGPTANVPLALLERYVSTIVALIVSHNDADHHRGALQILTQYRGSIEELIFLEDRPLDHIGLYHQAKRLRNERALKCRRLERDDDRRYLYRDDTAGLFLELLYPTYLDNLEAREVKDANATCGMLAFFCGARRIMFSGDAPIEAWERIHERMGPLPSDLLVVPHHGGANWPRQRHSEDDSDYESRVRADLRWLYTGMVPASRAVISVGTSNDYGHPHEWVVEELRSAGAVVLCTQMTTQCADDLEQVRSRGVRPIRVPARSSIVKDVSRASGKSQHVACAGTIVAEVRPDSLVIEHLSEHQTGVDEVSRWTGCHPLCRRR